MRNWVQHKAKLQDIICVEYSVVKGGRAATMISKAPVGIPLSRPLINAAVHRRHLTSPFSSPPLHSDRSGGGGEKKNEATSSQRLLFLCFNPHKHLDGSLLNTVRRNKNGVTSLLRENKVYYSFIRSPKHAHFPFFNKKKSPSGYEKKGVVGVLFFDYLFAKMSLNEVELAKTNDRQRGVLWQHRPRRLPQYDWGLIVC